MCQRQAGNQILRFEPHQPVAGRTEDGEGPATALLREDTGMIRQREGKKRENARAVALAERLALPDLVTDSGSLRIQSEEPDEFLVGEFIDGFIDR